MERVADPDLAAAMVAASDALGQIQEAGVEPQDAVDATRILRGLEEVGRKVRAVQVAVTEAIDRRALFRNDGHSSTKVMVRHACRLANPEAARRVRAARALRLLPAVREAFLAGEIGVDHLDRIARLFANPRIRKHVVAQDENLAVLASRLDYRTFDAKLRAWEALVDEDGARDRNQRAHDQRDLRLVQEFDHSWTISGSCASLDGARTRDILDAFTQAELEADWAEARQRVGDAATVADLARTDAQRRFDAFTAICELAAQASAQTDGVRPIHTTIVMDEATFDRHLQRLEGRIVPVPGWHLDLGAQPPAGAEHRCTTATGHHLEPTEAAAASLTGYVRRCVIGADSVPIDLGRERRLFTGAARSAALVTSPTCYWPGCWVPAGLGQVDHLQPWRRGGRTDQDNAGPLCSRHNRLKEHGYTARRDPSGRWHVNRPDGSEIT